MSDVKQALEDIAGRVLESPAADLTGARLEDLGLNFVNAVALTEEINAMFDTTFPVNLVRELGEINRLAEHIESELGRRSTARDGHADGSGDIAVIGMSCRAAGAEGPAELWEVISQGRDCTAAVVDPVALEMFREHFPDAPPPRYGAMAGTDAFDPAFFRISPREAAAMDAAQRILLESCYQALEDAAQDPASLRGSAVATIIGSTGLAPQSEYSAHALLGADASIMAARLAYHLDLTGPAIAVDTACSSSLVALDLAGKLLSSGEADMALVGGVFVCNHPGTFVTMQMLGIISPSRVCRPFDARADGVLVGEGVGVLVLKRLSDAVRDNDRVYGVVRASGTNQDGRTSGITSPSYLAQSRLLRRIYRRGGIDVEDLGYLEAHGTGTMLGDPIEIHGLTEAFAACTERRGFCAIGSIKANIGHTMGAAGVLGAIKVLLCLQHGKLPPIANFGAENEHISFADSPVYVSGELADWSRNAAGSRLAAVSSFGYSGTNAHVVIEEYTGARRRARAVAGHRPQLVPLSAKNDAGLRTKARCLVAELRARRLGDGDLADVAYTLQIGREAMPERAAVVARSMAELTERLDSFAHGADAIPGVRQGRVTGEHDATHPAGYHDGGADTELAARWCAGLAVNWPRLHTGSAPRRLSLPGHPFERVSFPHAWAAGARVADRPAPGAVPSVLTALDAAAEQHLRSDPMASSIEAALGAAQMGRELAQVCRDMLAASLRRMGIFEAAGERNHVPGLTTRLRIVDEHAVLFGVLLDILTDAGYLRREGDDVVVTSAVAAGLNWEPAELDSLGQRLAGKYPQMAGFARLLTACLDAYPDILTGRRKAHEVLFPGGSFDALEDIYHGDADTNDLMAALIGGYVQARLDRDPQARVSLFEVGAGTGGTTARVLPALDRFSAQVRYVYTDISRSFTQYGANRYGKAYPFVEFAPFNVESAPAAQGFQAGTFDVVLASNVLHATSRMDRSLAHVGQLLRPGGVLVLMEATQVQDVFTLIFGLTPGWWAFEDAWRLPRSPLLSVSMWRQALERAGLGSVRALTVLPVREDHAAQALILAENEGAAPTPDNVGGAGGRAASGADAAHAALSAAVAGSVAAHTADGAARANGANGADTANRANRANGADPADPAALQQVEGTVIEHLVTEAWREVLGVQSPRSDDEFQELGGDSILATQIISRLKSSFPIELNLGDLFEARTIAQMARLLEAELVERIHELPDETVRSLLASPESAR